MGISEDGSWIRSSPTEPGEGEAVCGALAIALLQAQGEQVWAEQPPCMTELNV